MPVRPAPEQARVSLMRDDVVYYLGLGGPAFGKAHDTEWVLFSKALRFSVPLGVIATLSRIRSGHYAQRKH